MINGMPDFIAISQQEAKKSKDFEAQVKALMSGKPSDVKKLMGGDQSWVSSFDMLMGSWMNFGSIEEIMKSMPKPGDVAKALKSKPLSELGATKMIDISDSLPPGFKMPKLKK